MKSMSKLRPIKNANVWKFRSFCWCLVVIYYSETVLKNFGVIKGIFFHLFHQAYYKNFVILVLCSKYSAFVPIFMIIDWKLARYEKYRNSN